MADYNPPLEKLPIFDSSVFLVGDVALTQTQADKRYLRYPNAQGTENLAAINVNGAAVFNSSVKANTSITYIDNTIQNSAFTGASTLAGSYTLTNMTIDSNGKITALSNGSAGTQFVPTFRNYTDTQTGTSGYSNGTQINFGGTWAINDIAYFRITSQISYYPDGNGAYSNDGNTMGVIYFRPYYFTNNWAPVSSTGGTLQKYCTNNGTGGANKTNYYYLHAFNIGSTSFFYLNNGGPTSVRISVLNPSHPYEFFCSIEYLGARTTSGTVSFSNGTDTNGINNSLP